MEKYPSNFPPSCVVAKPRIDPRFVLSSPPSLPSSSAHVMLYTIYRFSTRTPKLRPNDLGFQRVIKLILLTPSGPQHSSHFSVSNITDSSNTNPRLSDADKVRDRSTSLTPCTASTLRFIIDRLFYRTALIRLGKSVKYFRSAKKFGYWQFAVNLRGKFLSANIRCFVRGMRPALLVYF